MLTCQQLALWHFASQSIIPFESFGGKISRAIAVGVLGLRLALDRRDTPTYEEA